MRRKTIIAALIISALVLVGGVLLFLFNLVPGKMQSKEPLSFEEALAAARNPQKPIEKWMHFEEYRRIGDYKQSPYKAEDGSMGHYLYRAADGTLFEATYPSGEVGDPIIVFIVPSDKEAYYVWEIIADKKQFFVDASNGEVLFVGPAFK